MPTAPDPRCLSGRRSSRRPSPARHGWQRAARSPLTEVATTGPSHSKMAGTARPVVLPDWVGPSTRTECRASVAMRPTGDATEYESTTLGRAHPQCGQVPHRAQRAPAERPPMTAPAETRARRPGPAERPPGPATSPPARPQRPDRPAPHSQGRYRQQSTTTTATKDQDAGAAGKPARTDNGQACRGSSRWRGKRTTIREHSASPTAGQWRPSATGQLAAAPDNHGEGGDKQADRHATGRTPPMTAGRPRVGGTTGCVRGAVRARTLSPRAIAPNRPILASVSTSGCSAALRRCSTRNERCPTFHSATPRGSCGNNSASVAVKPNKSRAASTSDGG